MARTSGKRSGWALLMIIVGVAWGVAELFDRGDATGGSDEVSASPEAGEPLAETGPTEEAAPVPASWPPLQQGAAPPAPDLTAVNYYIVLDGSGSMQRSKCSAGSTKIAAALSALQRFVGTVPPAANLGLAVFDDDDLTERVPLAVDNRDSFAGALRRVAVGGGTPLRSAIELGYEKLTAQAQRQLGYGEYHLVVVTDGNPDPSSEDPSEVVEKLLDESPVVLHTIGFCIGTDHVLNQPGRSFYMAADDPAQLEQSLASVLAEAPSFDPSTFNQ